MTWVTAAVTHVKTVCIVIGKERKVLAPGVQVPMTVTVNEEQIMKV